MNNLKENGDELTQFIYTLSLFERKYKFTQKSKLKLNCAGVGVVLAQ